MPKKQQLTQEANTGKLSRLKEKDLPLIGIDGLNQGDLIAPFGTLTSDIIEYCVYDTSDNYLASGQLEYPLPTNLDIGTHVRTLGYERGTYKVVYNFLRQIGGSNKVILTKKSDKSIWKDQFIVETNGRILAAQPMPQDPEVLIPFEDPQIELLVQEDKFWLQELSPSRTEIRLRPNPAINDPDYFEQFRLLGYTCLSYSDVSGESNVTFNVTGKTVTINGGSISLSQAMVGGTLKIRDAFVIDYDETPEITSRYNPIVETDTLPEANNLVTNGNFFDGNPILERGNFDDNHEIVENIDNPGNSKWVLKTTAANNKNMYEVLIEGIPGETYIFSCWVHWEETFEADNENWIPFWGNHKRELFKGKWDVDGTLQNMPNNVNVDDITLETRVIDGRRWHKRYTIRTIPENSNGTMKWYLGWTVSGNTTQGVRYITDVQCEPGSLGGQPTPYINDERKQEIESPTTGIIKFVEDNKVEAVLSDEDDGFIDMMQDGTLTIKDAFVVDEVFNQDTEVTVIDDIPLKNALATDIKKYEREFRVSPYHGTAGANKIWIRVDNNFTITSYDANNNPTEVGTSFGVSQSWMKDFTFSIPNNTARLQIQTRENSGAAGFIARVVWNGEEYRTGDGTPSYADEQDWKRPHYDGSEDVDYPQDESTYSNSSGPFRIISNSTNEDDLDWKLTGGKTNDLDKNLRKSKWVWATKRTDNQDLVWEWTPETSVTDFIWKYPDPILRSDAVWVEGWSEGFNAHDWGGNDDRRLDRSFWHSGWLGHHAKWVQGEGQFGETCMKMIDKNNQFPAPNHENYPVTQPHKTGFVTTENSPDQKDTLRHRWMGIAQTLPHAMSAQGIEVGSKITISWWQKSDTINKGAQVGIHHYRISNGSTTWGQGTGEGYHPLASTGVEYDGIPAGRAWQHEFLRYIPISKVGEWEQVSYTGIVDDDWDLSKPSTLYVYGHKGPEGILWVENPTIQLTESTTSVNRTPVTADLVAQIESVNGNTLILNDTYENLAPANTVFDNASNIRSFNPFDKFYVDYISQEFSAEPVYGTLRGDIESISGNSITLVNTYQELGLEAEHDFSNEQEISQFAVFDKWFIQYPADKSEDLSKLLKTGPNEFQLITNFKIDQNTYPDYPYSVVYKLYEPLPDEIQEKDYLTIVREMIPPVEETFTLVPFIEEWISDSVLRTPEFGSTMSPIGSGQTEFKNYGNLVSNDDSMKESIENEVLSGSLSADINVDFSIFENFVHFSSAEQRLKNFKYKLDQIQEFTDRSASLSGAGSGSTGLHSVKADPGSGGYLLISGSENAHPSFTPVSGSLTQIQHWEKKRREQITSFDKFEKFMFFQSSSYSSESLGIFHDNAWPKESGAGTYSSPYVLSRTSQSAATTWYSNQLISASAYDKSNKNRLRGHLPMFVQDDSENDVFLKFIDMIGHHFDDIWTFIKSMTDVHDKRDKLSEGVAKTLLHPVAQSLGWEVYDGKDLISLPQYMFGMQVTGSEKPVQFSTTADRDISREIWSRIINNMPYLLKSKGSSRAIKGLISCYGIPSSILRVIEYGGPKLPGQSAENFLTRKFTKALDFFGASNNTYVETNSWFPVISGSGATNRHPDTVEFRFKAASGSNQVLVRRGDDWAIRLKDNDSSDNRGHVSFMLSGSRGYLEVSSSEFPVYDGEFYSVMLTRTLSGSGDYVTSNTGSLDVNYNLYTKKYDSGRSKIIYESTDTLLISGSMGVVSGSYNLAYSGSDTTIRLGGPQSTDFGESLSGSIMEYRNWTTALNESAFNNHVSAPIAFDGNTPSSSYIDLVTRYSFDDDKDLSVGYNQWFQDVTADQSFTASAVPHNYTTALRNSRDTHFSSVVDETKMKVPNLGPSGRSSNKLRIEADERIDKVGNPILKFGESITVPAYDKAPTDSNKLGVFFSPSAAIDEDIILSMPNLDFDQYIGDPRDQYKEQYTGLTTARDLYWQKYSGPNNFWDYLRLLKYYDASLYKQVHDLVPARANATVGILIEPTLLERDKVIIGKKPTFEPQHHTVNLDIKTIYVSESAAYQSYEDKINWSFPGGIDKLKQETGSYMSASANYESFRAELNFMDPYRVNWYTKESGSTRPAGLVSASAMELTPEMLNTMPLNLHDPHRQSNKTQQTGSTIELTADLVSYSAPSNTLSAISSGTGSFVLKHILERPSLYNIGSRDESGWYGNDYSGSTIQFGSTRTIFEEVVLPRVEQTKLSLNNDEIMYYYSSSLSASMHLAYSSSFVRSDLDNKWDEAIGTDRLFYVGCVQDDTTTVADGGKNFKDKEPAVFVELVSPTMLVTSDKTTTKMDVSNK